VREFEVVVDFPAMRVGARTDGERVVAISFLPRSVPLQVPVSDLARRVASQLERYRDDPGAQFDLPLAIEGTPFQRRVWEALRAIPCGRTLTYGEIAQQVQGEARAVGQACGDNRLPIVIPCHRAVAADGLGGFAHSTGGTLLEVKRWLLRHETGPETFELRP
jgi:methylated-DNA-[protein]-cysteine S-methyltransferase